MLQEHYQCYLKLVENEQMMTKNVDNIIRNHFIKTKKERYMYKSQPVNHICLMFVNITVNGGGAW